MHRTIVALAVVMVAPMVGCDDDAKVAPNKPVEPANIDQIQQALASIAATCADVSGKVEVRRSGQAYWQEVSVGATFRVGDWVRTGSDGYTRLQFLSAASLELDQNTTIIIDEAMGSAGSEPAGTLIVMKAGVARGTMDESGASTPLFIGTKDGFQARLAAQGDQPVRFRLTSLEHGTEVAVSEGQLELSTKQSGAKTLKTGEVTNVGSGKIGAISKLVTFPISIRPGVGARFLFDPAMTIELSWKRVKSATGYRVQIARGLSFREILVSSETRKPKHALQPSEPGVYAWRVAARNSEGHYSENGFGRRFFLEATQPHELLLSPRNFAKFAFDKTPPAIEFSWQSSGAERKYRLKISRGPNPSSNPVVDRRTSNQRVTIRTLQAGQYHWGVYAGDLEQPIFLSPRRLTVKRRKPPKAHADGIWD